jgi:hypothetical protein
LVKTFERSFDRGNTRQLVSAERHRRVARRYAIGTLCVPTLHARYQIRARDASGAHLKVGRAVTPHDGCFWLAS